MNRVDDNPRLGFIGLGVMGAPIAMNLCRAGYRMTVFDIDEARITPLVEAGATRAPSVREVAVNCDVVLTSLPGPPQIREIGLGEEGLLRALATATTWIELSTSNEPVCRELVTAARSRGIRFLDSPVSGGDEGARAGTLTILVGAEHEDFEAQLPLLSVIGERIEHVGANGAGYAAKIAQVVLCYVHSLALSEAMMLGVKGGVDPARMLSIIRNSTGRSYVADRYGPPILDGDYDPSFTLRLAHKDMRLASELAESLNISLPLCDLTTATYRQACQTYGGESNHLMAVRLLEEASGRYLRAAPSAAQE